MGTVFADTLAELGSDLILIDRPGTNLQELKETISKRWGISSEIYECDLEIESDRNVLIKTLESEELNVLVNNAAFHLTQGFYPSMQRSSGASIINISSMYGSFGPDYSLYEDTNMGNPAAYAASKGGLVQLTRWLSTTLAPNIRVNAISPGGIARSQPVNFVSRYEEKTPLRRMANEDDFRGPLAFLASDLSKYMTGQILHVDGGWGIW